MAGRPSKLTSEILEKLYNYVRMALPLDQACRLAGINPSTYYLWKKRASEGTEPEYLEFIEKLDACQAEAQAKLVQDIQLDKSWQSKAWILERRFSKEWKPRQEIKHEGLNESDIQDDRVREFAKKHGLINREGKPDQDDKENPIADNVTK